MFLLSLLWLAAAADSGELEIGSTPPDLVIGQVVQGNLKPETTLADLKGSVVVLEVTRLEITSSSPDPHG